LRDTALREYSNLREEERGIPGHWRKLLIEELLKFAYAQSQTDLIIQLRLQGWEDFRVWGDGKFAGSG
jgi:hypothetical protein